MEDRKSTTQRRNRRGKWERGRRERRRGKRKEREM